nr:hypothetical protein [Nanoarchaeum sp.]
MTGSKRGGVKPNKRGLRIANYHDDFDQDQLVRKSPTLYKISPAQRESIDRFADGYIRFLSKVKIAPEAVNEAKKLIRSSNLETRFIKSEDETAFVFVKYGRKPMREGVKIIYAHTDSPSLKTKPNPVLITWDPDLQRLHNGIELDMFGYGGINPHQWTARTLNLRGWSVIDGRRKLVNFNAYSPDIAAHTDLRSHDGTTFSEGHLEEELDLTTGFNSRDEFLESIGFKSQDDFNRSRIYAVPISNPTRIGAEYISGYGHDDRSCLYSAIRAAIDSKKVPNYTTIVCGFDLEEVGSEGSGGAGSKFFDRVIDNLLIERGEVKGLEDLTGALKLDMAKKSLAINADVEVLATSRDADHHYRIDQNNIPIAGYGAVVFCADGIGWGENMSPKLMDRIMSSFKGTDVVFQPKGMCMLADLAQGVATMNEFFVRRGYPTINIGLGVGSTHGPEEVIHIGDLYHSYLAYKTILNSPK